MILHLANLWLHCRAYDCACRHCTLYTVQEVNGGGWFKRAVSHCVLDEAGKKNVDEEVNEEMDELFEEEKNLHDDTL